MALLSVTQITQAGVDRAAAAVAAASGGDSVNSSGNLSVQIFNGDASPHTLTVARPKATTPSPPYGTLALADLAIVVPAGEDRDFIIPPGYASSGVFSWTYDAVTSVTVGVFSLA